MTGRTARGDDSGTATIEFVLTALLMLVPLAYVVLAGLQVQRTAYAVEQAARSGVRAFVTAPSVAVARERAQLAVRVALADQGVPDADVQVRLSCSAQPCLTPSAKVRLTVSSTVHLPLAPDVLGRPLAGVPVRAEQELVVDPFRPARS